MTHDRVTDGAAAVSIGAYIMSKLVEWTPELQALSLAVAILAGLFAVVRQLYRFYRWLRT